MKRAFVKLTAMAMCLVTVITMFTACETVEQDAAAVDAMIEAAVQAALRDAEVSTDITINVDGKQITIEDASGMSIEQMLERAKITVNEGDMITIPAAQALSDNFTIQVVRNLDVQIVTMSADGKNQVQYNLSLAGGTVGDALAAAGLTLSQNQKVDHNMEDSLKMG